MAKFFTDFSGYPGFVVMGGLSPGGWTQRWGNDSNTILRTWGDSEVFTNLTGGRILAQWYNDSSNRARVFSWDFMGNELADVDVVARLITEHKTGYQNSINVRVKGDENNKAGYYAAVYTASGQDWLVLEQWVNNTWKALAAVAISYSIYQYFWIRLRAVGNQINAKFWLDGTSEPSSWTITHTDTSDDYDPDPGWVAFGSFTASNGPARGYDIIGVGTDGDPGPAAPVVHRPAHTTKVYDGAAWIDGIKRVRVGSAWREPRVEVHSE